MNKKKDNYLQIFVLKWSDTMKYWQLMIIGRDTAADSSGLDLKTDKVIIIGSRNIPVDISNRFCHLLSDSVRVLITLDPLENRTKMSFHRIPFLNWPLFDNFWILITGLQTFRQKLLQQMSDSAEAKFKKGEIDLVVAGSLPLDSKKEDNQTKKAGTMA